MRSSEIAFRIRSVVGDVVIELRRDRAPETCRNFADYANSGRLDHSSFYRVLGAINQRQVAHPIDIVQAGLSYDPARGYQPELGLGAITHETTLFSGLKHRDGVVSMGRFAPGETYGGFFVCIGDQPELDFGGKRFPDRQGAAAFGLVREGMAVIRRIHALASEAEFLADPVAISAVHAVTDIDQAQRRQR
jgi:peptidyl-prolyl cis-trans isomerase A (cyclophilin A)